MSRELTDIERALDIPDGCSDPYVNPLQLAIRYESDIAYNRRGGKDYRDLALDRCIDNKVSFTSETNSLRNFVRRVFDLPTCPSCGKTMKPGDSGGSATEQTFGFRCGCGVTVSLRVQNDAMRVTFPATFPKKKS